MSQGNIRMSFHLSNLFPIRARSRFDLLFLILLAAMPFAVPGAVIFSHGLLGADLPDYHIHHQRFMYDEFHAGHIPFWNPYIYAGDPEFGNPERAPMYPPVFGGLMLLGPETMLKVKYLLHLGLLGVGMFLLLRQLSLSSWLAFSGALIIQHSGYPITGLCLPNVGDSATWIPLMFFLNLWFMRRPSLKRGLAFALAGGVMLLLFFPQITLTTILLLAIFGFFSHMHISPRSLIPSRTATLLDRFALPLLELALIILLLRYPPGAARFPNPGWRFAFNGLGKTGAAILCLIPAITILWLFLRRMRIHFAWRHFARYSFGFAAVWLMAAAIAAPQLAVTGEMIMHSNQKALDYRSAEAFFTGAQAYGSIQSFVEVTALGKFKETVNNMAIGPAIYLLLIAGIVAGFHRRHGLFLLLIIGAGLTGAIYFAAPGLFEAFVRLPFFGKFSGLSRYLSFLNFFMITAAMLSAHYWLRRTPAKYRKPAALLVALLLLLNLGVLARHEARFWKYLTASAPTTYPDTVCEMATAHFQPRNLLDRLLVDARGKPDYVSLLLLNFGLRIAGPSSCDPMRLRSYDLWLEAHNRFLGVAHPDYRAALLEPTPSPWLRALRMKYYLYPPGNSPPAPSPLVKEPLRKVDEKEGWTLWQDDDIPPLAWPESDIRRSQPKPVAPALWTAEGGMTCNRLDLRIANPGPPTWLVIPIAYYPGWVATVNGIRATISPAHGFLQAVWIGAGSSEVSLEYRPKSFIFGWLVFLWATWAWIVLGRAHRGGRPVKIPTSAVCVGLLPVAIVACYLFASVPDFLWMRMAEFAGMAVLAALVPVRMKRLARQTEGI